jgi:RNA 3'-terminal phosphate cyclase (ATP)
MPKDKLEIDGSFGEGGGQILRTSLALSLVTGTPVRLFNLRAGRKRPGLQRQHLTAVQAAAQVGQARVAGAELNSQEITFEPGPVTPGEYYFSIGTAGSATLVLQTVLPPLLAASGPSKLSLEGGTHNPLAPPYDFLARSFLPLVNRMGPSLVASLVRPGFFPAGQGLAIFQVEPAPLTPLHLPARGPILHKRAKAVVARLPRQIAERELRVLGRELEWDEKFLEVEEWTSSRGPGNVVLVELESEHVTEVVAGVGQRGVRAEAVADEVVREVRQYLEADVPVGPHLADQLIVPLALAGGGSFLTLRPTPHTTTNAAIVQKFLDVSIEIRPLDRQAYRVSIAKA